MILLPAVDIRDGKAVRLVQGDFARETVYNDDPLDAGIYLIKGGQPVMEPGQMLLIKNDPKYNEQ